MLAVEVSEVHAYPSRVLVAASNLTRLPGPGYRPTDQLYLKPSGKMEELFGDAGRRGRRAG